jgi:ABC-type glycerol-3-phosphate transport system substrate-binding protein
MLSGADFRSILFERTYKGRLRKVNILQLYRKFIEKSRWLTGNGRAFFSRLRQFPFDAKKLDRFLFFAALAVLAIIAAGSFIPGIFAAGNLAAVGSSRRSDVYISRQGETLFGAEVMNALIREFEEQNPELRIRLEGDDPKNRDNQAEIIFFDEGGYSALVREDALHSLAPWISSEAGREAKAVPLVSFMDVFLYNIELLQAAGLDRPPKTRIEFLEGARAVAKMNEGNAYGFALAFSEADPLAVRRDVFAWIWAAGGEIRPPEAPDSSPVLSRTAAETIAFWGQLNREGLLAPGTFEKTGAERIEEFAQGKIAMLTASARHLPLLKKNMGGIFDITVIPASITAGKNSLGLSGIYAGISGDCANAEQAWQFIAFLAEQSGSLAAALQAVPGSPAGTFPGLAENPALAKASAIFEASETVDSFAGHPFEPELEQFIRSELIAAFKTPPVLAPQQAEQKSETTEGVIK